MVSAWSRTALPYPPLPAGLGQVSGGNGKHRGNSVSHWEPEYRKLQRFLDLYHHPHLSIHPLYWVCWWSSKGVASIASTMQFSTAVKLDQMLWMWLQNRGQAHLTVTLDYPERERFGFQSSIQGIQIAQQEQNFKVHESLNNSKRNLKQTPWNVTWKTGE